MSSNEATSSNEPDLVENRPDSLESRLTRLLLLGCGTLLLLTGVALDQIVERWMKSDFDRALGSEARALVSLTEQTNGLVEFDFVAELMPQFGEDADEDEADGDVDEDGEDGELEGEGGDEDADEEFSYFQLWLDGDEVFERSPSLGDRDLARDSEVSASIRFRDVKLPTGDSGRQVQLDFVPQVEVDDEEELEDANEPGETGLDPTVRDAGYRVASLVVAKPTESLAERIALLRWGFVVSGLLLLTLLAVLIRLAVRSGLKPLRKVNQQVEALDVERLGQRIEADAPSELEPLVTKLNGLLERLHAAFERERRFSSDVAHELRTPIAELRSLAEVGGRWPDDRIAVRQFFADVQAISEQMEQVVSQLLVVARTEAGIETSEMERIGLGALVDEVLAHHKGKAAQVGCSFRIDVPELLWLDTDPAKLTLMLHNLLTNAVAYCAEGGTIEVTAEMDGQGLWLAVSNPTESLAQEDLGQIFDRFWRKDEARATPGSSGLGLALVKSLSTLLGAKVDASLDGGIFEIGLRFPEGAAGWASRRAAS